MVGTVRNIVSSLGFGSQVAMAAMLVVAAFYVYRAVGMARVVSGVLGAITRELLVLLVVGAVVIGLGWASPNSALVWEHMRALWALISERGVSIVRQVWNVLS